MTQRTLFFSTITMLAVTIAAIGGPGRRMHSTGAGQGRGGERLAAYLGLSEAQVAQWAAIREATREQMLPVAEQRRANREALRAELENGTPDAQRVGELVIANDQLRDESRAIRHAAQERFVALLTPDQAEKYEHFREFTKKRRGRGMNRGPGGHGGFLPGSGN